MKQAQYLLAVFVVFALLMSGCSWISGLQGAVEPTVAPEESTELEDSEAVELCGDGICGEAERETGNCPEDCPNEEPAEPVDLTAVDYEQINEFEYYVTNPTSGSKLYVRISPTTSSMAAIPAIIFIPGGTGDSSMFTDEIPGGSAAARFTGAGFVPVVFDPEGRGKSEGVEDYNGTIGQDGLYAVTRFVEQLPYVGDIGYVSQSYGVSLAAGVLSRYPEGPAVFLIDWEGPANRLDITIGCKSGNYDIAQQTGPQDHACQDDTYWSEREAQTFTSDIAVPYHRLQSLEDHAQPDASHAVDMIQAATMPEHGGSGMSPWTRLNTLEPNTVYSGEIENLLTEIDREKYDMMITSASELFDQFGSGRAVGAGIEGVGEQQAVLSFGLMVHLEGWFDEVENEDNFNRHMEAALELADIFERYGAKVTFEASPETIEASTNWDNVLLELENRGHGIGVHADAGNSRNPNYNQQLFAVQIAEMKEDAEALSLTIQHVSGICSELDWVRAAVDAGYEFMTGGVGYCAMSMPEDMRPEEYRYCTTPSECHGLMVPDMQDRIHPWRTSTAYGDWRIDDPAGYLVILASDGGIKNLYEASLDPEATHGDMEYTPEDIVIILEKVEEALRRAEPGEVNLLYFALSIGSADVDEAFYTRMFEVLQPFVDQGVLEYKTMNEMYEEYGSMNQ